MKRWNIVSIFLLGVSGQIREISLVPGAVNIITGASGTGKSTLIKAIDYCLGSSKCELPAHVRRRSVAVGVKWTNGQAEMMLGRVIPPVGQAASTKMFASSGRNISIPTTLDEFEGSTTVDAAKAFAERAFGIGDVVAAPPPGALARGRATVRLVTPYLFVTKEVIYSESVLLHGLEKVDKARDIIAALPYFLRATDESSGVDERKLWSLKKYLEKEEAKEHARATAESVLKQRALSLLAEAHRLGLTPQPSEDASEADLMLLLQTVSRTDLAANAYPSESELGALHARRTDLLAELAVERRRSRATRTALREASGFQDAVTRQRQKLVLAEHLFGNEASPVCPVCNAPSERGRETAHALQLAISTIRAESVAVERVRPKLAAHDQALDERIEKLNSELRHVDDRVRTLVRQNEDSRRLATLEQLRSHVLGRISFFMEAHADGPRKVTRDLNVLRTQIAELEARIDSEAKEVRLRSAEAKVSRYASENFAALPTVAPCVGSELDFSARRPEIRVIEAHSGAVLRLPDVGSDQNYLAIHIALAFALHRQFEKTRSPVPGVLVLDQVSRPYFPTRGQDVDERQIEGQEEDEDIQAMRKHVDFLFAETERRSGLQVLLIEHAYFADDPRYVAATRQRWNRSSGQALIPLDWPVRDDA